MGDDLKEVRPYINLADSLEDSNPVFSYYLRKYAIQKAHQTYSQLKSSKPQAADSVFQQLNQWMPRAEQLSKMLIGQINVTTNIADLLDYTERLFLAADDEYRAKMYTTELAQNFMTTWRFYEVINHYSPLSEDQQKRCKYAKVKAVEVHKTIKELQKQDEAQMYRPEPPQLTPGRSVLQQPPGAYVPEPPQVTPGPNGANPYPTMSGFHIPPMQPFGAQEPLQPFNQVPPFPQQQSTYNNAPFNMQAPSPPQPPAFQPFQGPTAPVQQPAKVNPVAAEGPVPKKKIDTERITAQNQAMTQLQNAISELSFNRVGHAKEAIRNAMRLLEKYE